MKKGPFILLALLTTASLLLSACALPTSTPITTQEPVKTAAVTEKPQTSSGDIPAPFADASKKPRVALVREIGEGSFFERYLAGAQSMADQLGIELIESNARGDQAKMVTNIETAIQQKVDVIIVDHGRTDTLQPAIEKALEVGIKVVTFDLVIDNPNVPEIEQDDMLIGFMLSKQLAVDAGGNANVVYANVNGFAPLDKRDRAWQDFKWRYPSLSEAAKIGKVSESTAADTQTQMEAAIKSNPDATWVIAMYDEFAKGVVRAIQQAGLADKYRVYSVDVTNEDIQMMTEPNSPWKATVATDSYNVGRLAVRTAAALIAGEKVDKYLLVQPAVITQDFLLSNNIKDMDALVNALPVLGESPLVWPDWMFRLVERNGSSRPAIAGGGSGGGGATINLEQMDLSKYANTTLPAPFADASKKPRVALVREIGEGSFFERYLAGAQSMADQLGIELIESNARGDQAKMVTNIETAIQQKVDVIIVDHGRTDTLQPAIEKALEVGIKVVTFDLVIDNPNVPEIEQDDMLIGFMLSKQLAVDAGGNANVVYANVNGFAPLDKRDRAWQDFKWRYPSLSEAAKIGKVSESTAADTQTQMEAAIKSNPDATWVIAMYDEFAKGVVRAIQQAGLADKYRVYSVDVTNEDIQMMTEPNSPWKATVATDSYNVGRLAVRTAAALIAGEKVDKYLLVQPAVITQDFLLSNNIKDMDALVNALPVLGESPLVWPDWMFRLVAQNKK